MGKRETGKQRKPYEKPTAIKIAPEEAKRKLLDHARLGDQEAMRMLEMMFPEEAKKILEDRKKSA
jgi:hypothetical protein